MTLVNRPGHWQQMALASLDAGLVLDITVMPGDVCAVLDGLAAGGQAAAVLDDADSPYTLTGLAAAVSETRGMLQRAADAALAGVPDHIPGT